MARKVQQDIAGYNVGIASLGVEHTRVLECTLCSEEERETALDQAQSLLDFHRRMQRKLLANARTDGFRAPQKRTSAPPMKSARAAAR